MPTPTAAANSLTSTTTTTSSHSNPNVTVSHDDDTADDADDRRVPATAIARGAQSASKDRVAFSHLEHVANELSTELHYAVSSSASMR